MEVIADCCRRLADGCPGDTLVQDLRRRYTTPKSLQKVTVRVRSAYDGPMEERDAALVERALSTLCRTETERDLVRAWAADYARRPWSCVAKSIVGSNPDLDECCGRVSTLLPRNVRDVHITLEESSQIRDEARDRLRRRHEDAPSIDGNVLITHARNVLARPTHQDSDFYDVVLALLAVTGRRTVELLNGQSTFDPIDGRRHACVFRGQCKTVARAHVAYEIPLLAPYEHVRHALEWTRSATSSWAPPPTRRDAVLANRAVSQKYQSPLGKYLRNHVPYSQLPRVHTLRAVYASIVHQIFDCHNSTIIAVAHRILGHFGIEEALAYTAIRVDVSELERIHEVVDVRTSRVDDGIA